MPVSSTNLFATIVNESERASPARWLPALDNDEVDSAGVAFLAALSQLSELNDDRG